MRELDEEIGDIHSIIIDSELVHIQEIREGILGCSDIINDYSSMIANLDW
jgi:hypothetical protein